MTPPPRPFDRIVAATDAAMVVVTGRHRGEATGCLVGFHSQVSIEPERWGVWISRANHSHPILTDAVALAIHFLTDDQHDLARHFGSLTGDEVDKFAGQVVEPAMPAEGPWAEHERPPLLLACPTRIVGHRRAVLAGDTDHSCIVVEPVDVRAADGFSPLHYRSVTDVTPGHPAH